MLTCSKDVQRMFAADGPGRRCRTYLAQAQHTCTNEITPNQRRSSTYGLHQRVPSSILTGTIDTATNIKAHAPRLTLERIANIYSVRDTQSLIDNFSPFLQDRRPMWRSRGDWARMN